MIPPPSFLWPRGASLRNLGPDFFWPSLYSTITRRRQPSRKCCTICGTLTRTKMGLFPEVCEWQKNYRGNIDIPSRTSQVYVNWSNVSKVPHLIKFHLYGLRIYGLRIYGLRIIWSFRLYNHFLVCPKQNRLSNNKSQMWTIYPEPCVLNWLNHDPNIITCTLECRLFRTEVISGGHFYS